MSTLKVNTITDVNGGSSSLSVPGAAKAWVNFNGTGTVAIRAAMNVSSITDNGAGNYTVNFTTALSDANYSAVVNTSMVTTNTSFGAVQVFSSAVGNNVAPTINSFQFIAVHTGNLVLQDSAYLTVAVFR